MQSRRSSLIESLVNVSVGYGVALATQAMVFPLFGLHLPASSHLTIGSIFTAVSIARSYVIRRLFNRWGNR